MKKTPSLEQIKAYALSNQDIDKLLNPDTCIIPYPEFEKFNHIDDCFDKDGRCVFLFLTKSPTSGHWNCMFKRNGHIEYFSSYGDKPEAERAWVEPSMLVQLNQSYPYLMKLLRGSGYKVYYNTYPFQSDRTDIATCGRWVCARLIHNNASNEDFYRLCKQGMKDLNCKSLDDFIAIYTYNYLHK